jgi:energy-coupling factor transport system permease protein
MKSRFTTFHPLINFSYYIGSLILFMLFMHPIFLIVGITILIIIHYFEDRFRNLRRWLFFMFLTGLLILVMNPLFNERGRNLLFEVFGHRVTLEAVIYGGMSALSIVGVMALFVSYNENMTPNKLLFLFSRFLPQFAVLLMLTLRFIPLMRRRLEEISAVQTSKGISVHTGSFQERMKKGMLYIQILLTYSLEEAIQTADSMKARGYGQYKRSSYEYFTWKLSDKISLVYLTVLFLFCLYSRYSGAGVFTIYPMMESIGLQIDEQLLLFISMMFISFPLLVNLGDVFRWRI